MKRQPLIVAALCAVVALAWSDHGGPDRGHHRHPAAPSCLTAKAISATQIQLSWKDNSDSETGFSIERASEAAGCSGAWSVIAEVGTNVTTFNDTNGSPNRIFSYRVRAMGDHFCSPYSNEARALTFPSPPFNLAGTAVSTNQVDLTWTGDTNGESGFKIERAPDIGGTPGTWTQIKCLTGETNTFFSDTEVAVNHIYWYRVRAFNCAGDSLYTDPVAVSLMLPAAPSNLAANYLHIGQIDLAWNEVSADATIFKIERAPDADGVPGIWMEVATGGAAYPFYTDDGVELDQTYWYRVRASNALGDSPYSGEISVFASTNEVTGASTVDWSEVHQRIDGFGASSAFRTSPLTSPQYLTFFSTNRGIGLSLLRTRLSPDGSAFEVPIAQAARTLGARIWSTPWSPPTVFKTPNTLNGGFFVSSPANYQAYAVRLANYVRDMKNAGINLLAISVQNEPDQYQPTYESCIWTPQQIHEFVPYLYAALASNGVSSTKIMIPELSNWDPSFSLAADTLDDTNTFGMVGILANHGYYSPAQPADARGKTLWETEDSFLSGGNDTSIANGIYWGARIHSFLTIAGVNAWHYWWLTASGNGNQALIGPDGIPTKRLYALGQFSRFVRPDFYRIGAATAGTALVSAYKDSASPVVVVVAINPDPALTIHQTFTVTNAIVTGSMSPWITSATLSLSNQPSVTVSNATFTYTLPPYSIVTFVGQAASSASTPAGISLMPLPQLAAAMNGDGFTLQVNGSIGPGYVVEISSNLVQWTALFITNPPSLPFFWTDSDATNQPSRFYRVRLSEPAP